MILAFRGPPGGPLGVPLETLLGRLGGLLGRLGALLELSWGSLGALVAVLGSLGAVVKPSCAVQGSS